jgi:hypothetical protein
MHAGDGHGQGGGRISRDSRLVSPSVRGVHMSDMVVEGGGEAGKQAKRNSGRLHFDVWIQDCLECFLLV